MSTNASKLSLLAPNVNTSGAVEATTLDGLDSSQFLRSDASDTFYGVLSVLHDAGSLSASGTLASGAVYISNLGTSNNFAALQVNTSGGLGLSVQNSGNVGINTANPYERLHVNGAILAGGGISGGTSGTKVLRQVYDAAGGNTLATLGTMYSSGAWILGYGMDPKPGAVGYVSSFSNFSGARSALVLENNDLKLMYAAAQATAVGSDITGVVEGLKYNFSSATLSFGGMGGDAKLQFIEGNNGWNIRHKASDNSLRASNINGGTDYFVIAETGRMAISDNASANPTSANLTITGVGNANKVISDYTTLLIDDDEASIQVVGQGTGDWASTITMTNVDGNGDNHHWWLHNVPTTNSTVADRNALHFRYNKNSASSQIGGSAGTLKFGVNADGSIRLGTTLTYATLPSTAAAGTIAYITDDGGNLFFRDSSSWRSFTSRPGTSSNPITSSGTFASGQVTPGVNWFSLNGQTFQAYVTNAFAGGSGWWARINYTATNWTYVGAGGDGANHWNVTNSTTSGRATFELSDTIINAMKTITSAMWMKFSRGCYGSVGWSYNGSTANTYNGYPQFKFWDNTFSSTTSSAVLNSNLTFGGGTAWSTSSSTSPCDVNDAVWREETYYIYASTPAGIALLPIVDYANQDSGDAAENSRIQGASSEVWYKVGV